MDRITDKHLTAICDHINAITGSPATTYRTVEEPGRTMRANIGNYYISHAYGGACLHRINNESGGASTPLPGTQGHVPKRELYAAMRAYLEGIERGIELAASRP